MIKQRLIYTLLYAKGKFQLSRNFSLQAVGDLAWLQDNYDFMSIAHAIDELVVLNVERDAAISEGFCANVRNLARQCFVPLACGGAVSGLDDAQRLLDCGADKVVVNTLAFTHPERVQAIAERYGQQFLVGGLDYLEVAGEPHAFLHNGRQDSGQTLAAAVETFQRAGVGELLATSIAKDGTGQGFDLETLAELGGRTRIPLIASGGAGRPDHFQAALRLQGVGAVATANLFNFMDTGLVDAREQLLASGANLAAWEKLQPPRDVRG